MKQKLLFSILFLAVNEPASRLASPYAGRGRKSSQQRGADGSFIQPGKHHVVPIGQRAAAGTDLAVRILPQRLELPHRANSIEVANALAAPVEDANQLVIHTLQSQ